MSSMSDSKDVRFKRAVIYGLIVGLIFGVLSAIFMVADAHAICSQRYPYPGCTDVQQRALEAPTQHQTRAHYELRRWGQGRADNFSDALNTRLRNGYYKALRKADQHILGRTTTDIATDDDLGYTEAEALAAGHVSWQTFKAQLGCSRFALGPAAGWCFVGDTVNKGTLFVAKAQMKCNNTVFIGGLAVPGSLFIKTDFMLTTLTASEVAGAGVGGLIASEAGCMTVVMTNQIWNDLF